MPYRSSKTIAELHQWLQLPVTREQRSPTSRLPRGHVHRGGGLEFSSTTLDQLFFCPFFPQKRQLKLMRILYKQGGCLYVQPARSRAQRVSPSREIGPRDMGHGDVRMSTTVLRVRSIMLHTTRPSQKYSLMTFTY